MHRRYFLKIRTFILGFFKFLDFHCYVLDVLLMMLLFVVSVLFTSCFLPAFDRAPSERSGRSGSHATAFPVELYCLHLQICATLPAAVDRLGCRRLRVQEFFLFWMFYIFPLAVFSFFRCGFFHLCVLLLFSTMFFLLVSVHRSVNDVTDLPV